MRMPSAAIAAAALLSSCASMGDPFLVAFDIPPGERAAALARSGVACYETEAVPESDGAALERSRKYFEAALRYDPLNADAERYLSIIEDYRGRRLETALSRARDLYGKVNRSEEESCALFVALREAERLDPGNEAARGLLESTAVERKGLTKTFLDRSAAARRAPGGNAETKGDSVMEAFLLVCRALEIEPKHFGAALAYRNLRWPVERVLQDRIESAAELFKDGTFNEAKERLATLKRIDAKLEGSFRSRLRDAEYELYLSWAAANERKGDWAAASARAAQALALKRGPAAMDIAKRAAAAKAADDRRNRYDEGLKQLDAALSRGDLDGARRAIAALEKKASGQEERALIERRRESLLLQLGGLYERGVAAYREERFGAAVSLLGTVAGIDAAYRDAADYLEKARAKQRLVEQY